MRDLKNSDTHRDISDRGFSKRSRDNYENRKRKRRILVTDDEQDIAEVFRIALEQNGFEVDTFTDPIDALSNFKKGYHDIIISDVRMPNINGFDLCKELAKIDDKVKIFFVSSGEIYNNYLREQYPNLIIDERHYIDKPISISKLVDRISGQEDRHIKL